MATLSLFDTTIRRAVVDGHNLLPYIRTAMRQGACHDAPSHRLSKQPSLSSYQLRDRPTDSICTDIDEDAGAHRTVGVRYAAVQLVRVLCRGVEVLRTSVVDSGVGLEVFAAIERTVEDGRVVCAALGGVCNLVMGFSPLRSDLLNRGLMGHLVRIVERAEVIVISSAGYDGTSASQVDDGEARETRLNALWVVKNLLCKTTGELRMSVMEEFGWNRLSQSVLSLQLTSSRAHVWDS